MSQIGYSTLAVVPGFKDFGPKLSKGIGPELTAAGRSGGAKFGAGMASTASSIGGKTGKLLGVGILSTFTLAVAGIGAVLKTGFGEAMDASKGTAQLAAGIKSTGGAAGVSVKSLNDLASSIQGMSGQTDDSIVASEKLLLTFTNIKNSGPNKIFDMATLATADMAARMGGDASGAAIQLGKALNDPVKGITALSRVGVSFTQGQKDSIAAMVKSGDVMGAQKIILGELNTEFGGSAKAAGQTLPGQMAIAKRSFEDLSQTVVTGLMPAFSTGLAGINTFVQGVQKSFNEGGISKVFTDLGAKITAAWPGIQAQLATWGTAFWAWIQAAVPPMLVKLGELLVQLETWLWTVAYPAIGAKLVAWGKAFVEWITPMIPPFLAKLGDFMIAFGNWFLATALPWLGTHLLEWSKAFVAWVAPMIPPLIVALGDLLLKLGGWLLTVALPAIVTKLGEWALAFAKWVPGAALSLIVAMGGLALKLTTWLITTALPAIILKLGEWALAFARWVPGAVVGLIVEMGKLWLKLAGWLIGTALPGIISHLAQWAAAFIGWVAGVIVSLPGKLAGLLGVIVEWAKGVPGKIVSGLGNLGDLLLQKGRDVIQGFLAGLKEIWTKVTDFIKGIAPWLHLNKGPLSLDANLLKPHGNAIMQGFLDGLKSKYSDVTGFVSGVAGSIKSVIGGATMSGTGVASMMSALSGPFPGVQPTSTPFRSGGTSWHAKGRAVDLPPNMAIFNWIKANFPGSRELIFGPAGDGQVKDGKTVPASFYGAATMAQHYNHIHWAYANGTNNAAPGYAWVGEQGPEIVKFGGGETVIPNSQIGGGPSGGGETRLNRADLDYLADRMAAGMAGSLVGAASSTQLVSRNRPAW